jgi:hypothetical protein
LGFLDKLIDNFFENIKKRQRDRIIKNMRKKNPDLAKKLDEIDNIFQELDDYLLEKYGDELKNPKNKEE